MKKIWSTIKFWFKFYILFPIRARLNYMLYGVYISDNMRNRALLAFCEKVMADPQYEPQGIYENLFNDKLIEVYDTVINYVKETIPEDIAEINELTYELERPYCAAAIYENLLQMLWIED